jgi:glycosyltransferase involved in cell wall biosynthesis
MRIVHLYHDFYPQRGGIEDYLVELARDQARRPNVEPVILTANTQPYTIVTKWQGIQIIRAATFGRYFTPLCPSWGWWLKHLRPDWIHLHLPCPLGEWMLSITAVRVPLLVSLHNEYVRPSWAIKWHRPLHLAILRRAQAIIVGAPDYAASSSVLIGLQAKVIIVPYGIDLARYIPGDCERRREVLSAGRLCYYKGVEVLLLAASTIPASITILGDGPWRRRLQDQARSLQHVTFHGAVSEDDLIRYLQESAVFVFPSTERSEAFGLAQLKAMACGTPVISSNLPGVSWVNQHEQSGLVVPVRESVALAEATNELLENESKRAQLGHGARARAEQFPLERMLQATARLYT